MSLSGTQVKVSKEIDEILQNFGLHPYSIGEYSQEKEDEGERTAHFTRFLKNILTPCEQLDQSVTIDPQSLTQIAYGIVEELNLPEILDILSSLYYSLPAKGKLASIYLVKELILLDEFPAFSAAFANFISQIKRATLFISPIEKTTLEVKLKQLYEIRTVVDYRHSAFDLAQDLNKAFVEATLATNLGRKAEQNQPLLYLSMLSSKLSEMVCMDIVKATTAKEAVVCIGFYLDVIEHCLGAPFNYAAALAIYNGLKNFQPVDRMDGVKAQISSEDNKRLKKYHKVFSPVGSFAQLRKLMADNPHCIPYIGIYCEEKDKIASSPLNQRVMLNGLLNEKFSALRKYLSSLPLLSMPYRTHFQRSLAAFHYNESDAYWYSYNLDPIVINLDFKGLELSSLKRMLERCLEKKAPLVVNISDKQIRDVLAKSLIMQWLETKVQVATEKDEIRTLCDRLLQDDTSASLQGVTEQLESLSISKGTTATTVLHAYPRLSIASGQSRGRAKSEAVRFLEDDDKRKLIKDIKTAAGKK